MLQCPDDKSAAALSSDRPLPSAIRRQFLFCTCRYYPEVLGFQPRRRGREAEGGGLLNRYTVKSRIEGSNPSVSANFP